MNGLWRESDDYDVSAWFSDLTNIIKKRAFLLNKSDAWLVVLENMNEFLECYVDGMAPISAYEEFEGID